MSRLQIRYTSQESLKGREVSSFIFTLVKRKRERNKRKSRKRRLPHPQPYQPLQEPAQVHSDETQCSNTVLNVLLTSHHVSRLLHFIKCKKKMVLSVYIEGYVHLLPTRVVGYNIFHNKTTNKIGKTFLKNLKNRK